MIKGTSPNTPASQKVSILSLRRESGVKTLTKDPSVPGPSLLDAARQSAANAAKPDDPSVPLSPKSSLEAIGNRSLLMRRDSGGVRTIVKNSPTSSSRPSLVLSSSPSSRISRLGDASSSSLLSEPTASASKDTSRVSGITATPNVDQTFDQVWDQLPPDDKPKGDEKDDPFWANLLAEPLPSGGPNPFEELPVTPIDTSTPVAVSSSSSSTSTVNAATTPSPTSPESLTSVDMPASAASAQAALEALLSPSHPLSDNERDDPASAPISPAPQPSPPPSPSARRVSVSDSFSSMPPRSPRTSVTTITDTRPNRSMDARRPSRVGAPPSSPSSSSSAFSFFSSSASVSSVAPISPTARLGAVPVAPTSPTARSPTSSLTTSRSRALSSPSRSTLPSGTPRSPGRSSISSSVPKSPTASTTIPPLTVSKSSSATSTIPRSPSSVNTALSSAASVTASSLLAAASTTSEEKKQPEQHEDLTEEASDTVSAVVPRSRAFSSPAAVTKPPISPRFSFLATLPEIKPKPGYENKSCQADEFDGMAPSYGQLQSENISLLEENARLKAIISSLQASVGKSGSSSPASSPVSRSPRSRPPPPPPSEIKS